MSWRRGDVIVRREILGLQPGAVSTPAAVRGAWMGVPVHVVADRGDQLVTFIGRGAAFDFPVGPWPTPDGLHPWSGRDSWHGHGCLMVQTQGEHHAIWHFWDGPDREFVCWYLNLQTDFVRTTLGYDTQDLELDILVFPDGSHLVKDAELLDDRVAEGRYSPELVDWIRSYGDGLVRRIESDGPWWDMRWADWSPPPEWEGAQLPVVWNL